MVLLSFKPRRVDHQRDCADGNDGSQQGNGTHTGYQSVCPSHSGHALPLLRDAARSTSIR